MYSFTVIYSLQQRSSFYSIFPELNKVKNLKPERKSIPRVIYSIEIVKKIKFLACELLFKKII